MNLKILLLSAVAAAIPVFFWFFILKRKAQPGMFFRFWLTFFFAGAGAIYIFFHEAQWQNFLTARGIPLFFVFTIFGIIIEYFKNISVRICGWKYFKNIDQIMDLSFAAALGFTFFENIFHFYVVFSGGDPEYLGPVKGIKYFLHREFFILPVHLFCSGIFGYFYAMGTFSNSKLKNENLKSFWFLLFYFPLRVLFPIVSKKFTFRTVKIIQGTIVSIFFYGLFFTLLQLDPMLSDIFKLFGFLSETAKSPIDERLIPLISFVFFKVGSVTLFNLMDKKNRLENRQFLNSK